MTMGRYCPYFTMTVSDLNIILSNPPPPTRICKKMKCRLIPGAGLRMRQTSVLPREEREEQSPSAAPSREESEGGPTIFKKNKKYT
jgi:hypothetical protein